MLNKEAKSSGVASRKFVLRASVLIAAEDDLLLVHQLIHDLEELGDTVAAVSRSPDCVIPTARLCCADVIVIDTTGAGAELGVTLAMHVQEVFPLPIVFITAYSNDLASDRSELHIPHRVLTKPVLKPALHNAIHDLLADRRC